MKRLPLILLVLLAGCSSATIGSATTERPALTRPAIEPDGTFWDAVTVAGKADREAFLYLLSPQMIFRALFPEAKLKEVTTQSELDDQRAQIEATLKQHEGVVQEFATRYMSELHKLVRDRFIEVGKPDYNIKFNDKFDRATGPNTAKVIVNVYPKKAIDDAFKPEIIEVTFIQDGRRWLIHGFANDKLKGAFVR
jgi:hypothetical protein